MNKDKEEFIKAHEIRLEKAREKAKEKAQELFDKMTMEIGRFNSKQCALICVNEIIKSLINGLPEVGLGKGFWYNVREEIEKL